MKPLIPAIFLVFALSNTISTVFANHTMFREKLIDELNAVNAGKVKLDTIIQTEINENPGNNLLESIQRDFNKHFHPVVNELMDLHQLYTLCCEAFDNIYVEDLQKVTNKNDKKLLKSFKNVVKQGEGKVLMNFMIKYYLKHVQTKLNELVKKTSILHAMLSAAKQNRITDALKKTWKNAKNEADDIHRNLVKNTPKKKCEEILSEFLDGLEIFDDDDDDDDDDDE
ncbi:uncharacterized protein LOC116337126 [Contarinia nasturtii]|uniref:uncharacterized protein LOC116337126 n=1 Tax=Contarinia nasturtii TaxID=265458 RepID=UPI0012D43071|nr:uncharacterized protein LOC116337126 [Contarinia nasturtii]